MTSSWREILDETDRQIFDAGGYGTRSGIEGRVAILIVDVTYGFVGHEALPVLESITSYPSSCGEHGWRAIGVIKEIVATAQRCRIPVMYSAGKGGESHAARWRKKRATTKPLPGDAYDIVSDIRPTDRDTIIQKECPSLFFDTDAIDRLRALQVSSLIVTGGTTSGCVRATVVDAFSYGFRVTVVEDAVFDRVKVSHYASLLDMDQKYADVRSSKEVLDVISQSPDGWVTK